MPEPREREGLFFDLISETAASWRAMSVAERALVAGAMTAFFALNVLIDPQRLPSAPLAVARIVAFIALVIGALRNARTLDEFYQRAYLYAACYAFIASATILYALSEFGVTLGERAVAVPCLTFLIGFIVAFAQLRRA